MKKSEAELQLDDIVRELPDDDDTDQFIISDMRYQSEINVLGTRMEKALKESNIIEI